MLQQTLSRPVEFSGIGLHSGQGCAVTIKPAPINSGIIFYRTDLAAANTAIPVDPLNVVNTRHSTTLSNSSGVTVATVEHLMAALCLTGVDNAEIEVYGPEAPILDGSSADFLDGIQKTGLDLQSSPRRVVEPREPFCVRDGDRMIEVLPSVKRIVEVEIDFGDCMIGRQSLRLDLEDPSTCKRILRARTFCRHEEIEPLRAVGLIRGGSFENSLVVSGDTLMNGEELRDPYEFALHKALDLVGDLYLLGVPIAGEIRAFKPGHDLNTKMACALTEAVAAADMASAPVAERAAAIA